jgi:putative PIN family toxin of toxin-antitoxin system
LTVRAVVDPGVLVSALLTTEGPPAQILEAWRRGRFELIVSEQLLAELAEVLERPKFTGRISPGDRAAVLGLLREEGVVCVDPPLDDRLTEDADDDYLAALAVSADAQYLVTGDRALGRWRSNVVTVVTPRTFLDQL